MNGQRWSKDEANAELSYIARIAESHDYASFNGDESCFMRYAYMQSNSIDNAGFERIASDIVLTLEAEYGNA